MDEHETIPRRDVAGLVVPPKIGAVRPADDPVLPWIVVDETGEQVESVSDFLRNLLACGNSPASCRSYAYDLLRWLRFLAAADIGWHRAQRTEVRDFVLWLRTSDNPARHRRRPDAPAPGSVNVRTGKPYLGTGYAPATINHAVAVLSAFMTITWRPAGGRWCRRCRRGPAMAAG
jgi:integrase/recombinase XerC